MVILQKYFIDKRNIKTKYIFDDENNEIIKGTNLLPCNQNESEKMYSKLAKYKFYSNLFININRFRNI